MAAKLKLLAGLFAVAVMIAGPGHAGTQGTLDPCATQEQGHGDGGGLCARGPAGCVAIGLRVDVFPTTGLPGGANVELSRSQAQAFAAGYNGFAYGSGHGDAHQAQANVPPTLGAGAIESRCDASAYAQGMAFNSASGTAEIARASLSLYGYSIPLVLSTDVLREDGASAAGAGSNTANIASLSGWIGSTPIGPVSLSAPPNTTVSLGPLGTLYLNEQLVTPPSMFNPCSIYSGDAARLVVTNPATGLPIAQVLISWVSTSTCPY